MITFEVRGSGRMIQLLSSLDLFLEACVKKYEIKEKNELYAIFHVTLPVLIYMGFLKKYIL